MIVSLKSDYPQGIWITFENNQQRLSPQEYFKLEKQKWLESTEPGPHQNFSFEDFDPIGIINVDGRSGYQFVMPSVIEPLATVVAHREFIFYIFTHNPFLPGTNFSFRSPDHERSKEIYDQILSTFRFLE